MTIAQQSEHQEKTGVVSHPSSKYCSDIFIPAPEIVCGDWMQYSPEHCNEEKHWISSKSFIRNLQSSGAYATVFHQSAA